jgi:hypothetical protein
VFQGDSAWYARSASNLAHNNLSLHIPTPTFGNGLMEAMDASTLAANLAVDADKKNRLGILSPNDAEDLLNFLLSL